MTTPTFSPTDIVNFAAKKDAVNLATAFNDLVGQRMYDAIDARKREVANQLFNGAEEEQQEVEASAEEQEAEAEQAETETSNETEQEEHSEESDENAQETN
jgi:hypothetical protein